MKLYWMLLALPLLLAAESLRLTDGGRLIYPSEGVVNPAGGTVELTVTPAMELKEFRNEWHFAFQLPGRENWPETRSVLGLALPSAHPLGENGLTAIARAGNTARVNPGSLSLPRDIPANLAVSWGDNGLIFYRNGQEAGRSRFEGELLPFAPMFFVGRDSVFRVGRIKVSARQLQREELAADPLRPFEASPDCTLLANELEQPRFFPVPAVRRFSCVPFGMISERIFGEGEPLTLRLLANHPEAGGKTLPALLSTKDFFTGETAEQRRKLTIPAEAWQRELTLEFGALPPGFYAAELKIGDQPPRKLQLSVLPAIESGGKLGNYLGLPVHPEPELLKQLDIRQARLWTPGSKALLWGQVESEPGDFDFAAAEELVEGSRKNGIEILAVLGYPPNWAAEAPPKEAAPHLNHNNPARWKPRSTDEFARYATAVAERFRGRIGYYEIYNEVDFHPPVKIYSFAGTTKEYFELLKASSAAIRKADPAARVLISGFATHPQVCDARMPADLLDLGAAEWVDIWNLHAYRSTVGVADAMKLVHSRKPGMPFWMTEQMWHAIHDPQRRSYLTGAIPFWFQELGFEAFFSFGWGEFLTDEHIAGAEAPLHIIGVCQKMLASSDRYDGLQKGLPPEFDLRHRFTRADGRFLTVIGCGAENSEVRFRAPILAAWSQDGKRITATDKLETGGGFRYILSDAPLQIASVRRLGTARLLTNPDFEDLIGDTIAGAEHLRFADWRLGGLNDPKGSVTVETKAGNGRYAARLHATGEKKRVYLFQRLKLTAPGRYRLSARFKTVEGAPVPYLEAFDTTAGVKRLYRQKFATPAKDAFSEFAFEFDLDPLPGEFLAVSFGVYGPGKAILDDAHLEALPAGDGSRPVALDAHPSDRRIVNGRKVIDPALVAAAGSGPVVAGGVHFDFGPGCLAVASPGWEGAKPEALQKIAPARFKTVSLCGTGMFNGPEEGALLAELALIYEDGSRHVFPLRYNRELSDWYLRRNRLRKIDFPPAVAFRSPTEEEYGFYRVRLANPHPERPVSALRLTSQSEGVVLLRAVSVQ